MANGRKSRSGPRGGPGRSLRGERSRDARHLSPRDQEALRLRAINLLASGERKAEVARKLGVSRQSLYRWSRASREKGSASLKKGRRGRPGSHPLLPWQEARILKNVVLFSPEMLDLPYRCWTREAIAHLSERWFGIRLSQFLVGSYLKRWGFVPRRSVRYLFRNTPERLLLWLGAGTAGPDGPHHGLEGGR